MYNLERKQYTLGGGGEQRGKINSKFTRSCSSDVHNRRSYLSCAESQTLSSRVNLHEEEKKNWFGFETLALYIKTNNPQIKGCRRPCRESHPDSLC